MSIMSRVIPPRYAKEIEAIVEHQGDVLCGLIESVSVHKDDKPSLIKQRVLEIAEQVYRIKLDDEWRKEMAQMRKAS